MKKHVLIFSSILFAGGLAAYGILNDKYAYVPQAETTCNAQFVSTAFTGNILKPVENTDFFYDFGPRFNPITKKTLAEATSVSDFIDQNEIDRMDGIRSTTLIILENERKTDKSSSGKSEILTSEQLKMIHSLGYSVNFLLRAEFNTKDAQAASKGENIYYPHMTVVPEKQAAFIGGKNLLLDYFRENNGANTSNLDEKKLQSAKLYFTVTKEGKVSNARVDYSCGYPKIDQDMLELVKSLSEQWVPAEDERGEKVDQELVISYGVVGC